MSTHQLGPCHLSNATSTQTLFAVAPACIAHVGDRLDNDIVPAKDAGMFTAFVRRGPWGHLHARRPEVEVADLRVGEPVKPLAVGLQE